MAKHYSKIDRLSQSITGSEIASLSLIDPNLFLIKFTNGSVLEVTSSDHGLHLDFEAPQSSLPTKRQYEYLSFISKYIKHFGRSPAESDIQRHLLVSAPSVNSMIQTLEKRGFITRQQGVPRSIKLQIEV